MKDLETLFAEREPEVRAFLPEEGRFERLRREMETLQARWPDRTDPSDRSDPSDSKRRPPLFGVPIGVKDIFHVDGFPTRGGSRLPPEALRGPEAASVKILKEAGALILGKTVSTEFAFFAPGPTRNPWNPEHTPGGSSSGSAAAVGAGLCPLALGTQTIGSILRPAAFCGVVGFKPSYERISRDGVIPLAPSLDHVGFFTPNVAGAQRAAAVLCRDWRPAAAGRKPRLGIPEGPYLERASGEGLVHFRQVCHRLIDAGFEVEHVPALSDFGEIVERHFRITAAEIAHVHRDWFARFGDLYAAKTAELIRRGQTVTDDELARDLDGREELRDVLTSLMDQHDLDLWISPPALGAAPRGLDSTGDPVMNLPWSHAGMPAIALPAGRNAAGLPLGLQVVARWWADEALLAWAQELEEVVRP
jgi:Asp-tRNA(Asn)/Glu-tRNA(Gln) amidotransferase A subunit family amidase